VPKGHPKPVFYQAVRGAALIEPDILDLGFPSGTEHGGNKYFDLRPTAWGWMCPDSLGRLKGTVSLKTTPGKGTHALSESAV